MAIAHLWVIKRVTQRRRQAVSDITFLSIVNIVWGTIQLFSGVWIQILFIPLYVVMGVLVQIDKEYFNQLSPKELENSRKQSNQTKKTIGVLNYTLLSLCIVIVILVIL
jgi:hypothetical protein